MEAGDFRFSATIDVEISDTDLGGVVYYGRYSRIVDAATVAYRRDLGIPALGPEGHLFVVRRLEVDYMAPARFGDRLDVGVRTTRLGRSSHEVASLIWTADGQIARALAVIVGVSHYGGRPTRIPPEVADPIRRFEGL